MEQLRLEIGGRPARPYVGGRGARTMLLLHGGWGGASMHWSRLWDRLTPHVRVIAPDLPGIGDTSLPGLKCLSEYVVWLERLLDTLDAPEVVVVGNSFGGSLAWSFAGRRPSRCAGVVLVDGIPMPRTPAPLAWLGRRRIGRATMRAIVRRVSFTPSKLASAFADPRHAPDELRRTLGSTPPRMLETFVDCLIAGDGPPTPRAPAMVMWGEQDRLAGTAVERGRELARSLGARWAPIADAGHFPQLEQPALVADALEAFARGR